MTRQIDASKQVLMIKENLLISNIKNYLTTMETMYILGTSAILLLHNTITCEFS